MLLPFGVNVLAESHGDSHNVDYGSFAPIYESESGTTTLETGIMEYMVTFPKKTAMIPYLKNFQKLGAVTVQGKAFIKPYKVSVNISKQDFKLVSKKREKNKSNKIAFDVTRVVRGNNGELKNGGSLLGETLYYYRNDKTEDEHEKHAYENGEVADIEQSVDVGVAIKKSEWKKASPGKYKGKITFLARLDNSDIF